MPPVKEDDLLYTRFFAIGMFDHTDILPFALLEAELAALNVHLQCTRAAIIDARKLGGPSWRASGFGWTWKPLHELCQRITLFHGYPVTTEGNDAA